MMTSFQRAAAREQDFSIARLLSRGSVWAIGWQLAAAGASLIATPFTVRLLGSEHYGMLVLIGMIINYGELADLGMGQASTWFAAGAHSAQDNQREAAIIWTSMLILVGPILVASLLLFLSSGAIASWVSGSDTGVAQEAAVALKLSALALFLRMLSGVWNTPQLVRLRMAFCAMTSSGGSIAQTLLLPVVLLAGGGLTGAILTAAVVAGAVLILNVIFAQNSLPGVLHPVIRADLIGPLLKFGGASALASITAMILSGSERVLLPQYTSVAAVAHFSVAFVPVTLIMMLAGGLNAPLLAGFTRIKSTNGAELHRLYRRVVRSYATVVLLVLVFWCAFARPFFTVWAGPEYGRQSTVPFYILTVGAATYVIASVPRTLITALGRMDRVVRLNIAEIVPYLICSVFLISYAGAAGAALAWTVRSTADGLFLFFLASRLERESLPEQESATAGSDFAFLA